MIFAFLFLKESNPRVVNKEAAKMEDPKKKEGKRSKPKVTKLMALCFIFEFSVRWSHSAFQSRFGFFLSDKFNTSSDRYSYYSNN